MITVLAAIGRVVLGAILALTAIAAMLWTWAGPQGWPVVVFLLVLCTVIVAAGLGIHALQPKGDGSAQAATRPERPERPDYQRIAELERGLYGHAFPEGDIDG